MPRKQNFTGLKKKKYRVKNVYAAHAFPQLSSTIPTGSLRSLQTDGGFTIVDASACICVLRYVCGCTFTCVGPCVFFHTSGGKLDAALYPQVFFT